MEIVHQIKFFLGIDVGKLWLVVCLMSVQDSKVVTKTFPNDASGVEALLVWLGESVTECRVLLEATSRYHRLCERGLWNAGALVELVNPRRARALAIGLGIADKDDKVDARVLAQAAQLLQRKDRELESLAAQDLKDHSRAIDKIKSDAAKHLKRLDGLDPDSKAYRACNEAAKALKAVAEKEEREWRQAVKEDAETYRRYRLAMSVPDVGHVTARIVSVELPSNLESANTRKLTAYAGLVPRKHQSGNSELPPQIYGGNAHLRTGVYMAAVHAVYLGKRRFQPAYANLVARPHILARNKGGKHLKAIVALMRKLLTNIIAVLKRNEPWTQQPPTYPKPKRNPFQEGGLTNT